MLSTKTRDKLISLLIDELQAKQTSLINAEISLTAVQTSWECKANLEGYLPPAGHANERDGPVHCDHTLRQDAINRAQTTVSNCRCEALGAMNELLEIIRQPWITSAAA